MPAYFSIEIECSQNHIFNHIVEDVCKQLVESGFAFKSGYFEAENESLENIINWNQRKLEDNLVEWKQGYPHYKQEQISPLLSAMQNLWQKEYIDTIQTTLELSDAAPTLNEIKAGSMPAAEPFAIVPVQVVKDQWRASYQSKEIERNGLLLMDEK